MKRFQVLVAATLLVSTATTVQADKHMCGWYGGVQGGVETLTARQTGNSNLSAGANTINTTTSYKSSHTGGIIGLFGGYGRMIRDWYVAAQLQGDVGDFNNKSDLNISSGGQSVSFKTRLRANSLWGATGLVGYQMVKDTVAYVGAGVDYARWRYSEDTSGSRRNSNQFGFAPRFGVRTLIAKNLFLNAEYKYSFFRKVTLSNSTTSLNATPRVQTFTVGVAFKTN